MQAPAFWWQAKTEPVARLLTPLASLYGWTAARRLRKAGARLPLPVICIGNFVAGGAGKHSCWFPSMGSTNLVTHPV